MVSDQNRPSTIPEAPRRPKHPPRLIPRTPRVATLPTKPCTTCGREITWRKKWERTWDQVKYCSEACRRSKTGDLDEALELAILTLLKSRVAQSGRATTICPSEAARAVAPDNWNPLMDRTRNAARRLVARGTVEITQGGRAVDPSRAKGPIRIKLA